MFFGRFRRFFSSFGRLFRSFLGGLSCFFSGLFSFLCGFLRCVFCILRGVFGLFCRPLFSVGHVFGTVLILFGFAALFAGEFFHLLLRRALLRPVEVPLFVWIHTVHAIFPRTAARI